VTAPGAMRVGLIGAGWIGRRHAANLASRGDVALTAVCDMDLGGARQVAAECGGTAFTDWREMLDQTNLDAVWVCTPPRAHTDPAVACLDRGLAVYLEKPIARSPDGAYPIVRAALRGRAVCAVGYQWRAVDVLDDLLQAQAGRAVGCLVAQSIGGTQSRPWFLDRAAGGGNLLERGSHHIDLARVLAGEVVSVQAAAATVRLSRSRGGDIEDAVSLLLRFASGGLGTIVVAWTSDDVPGSYWVEVMSEDAMFRLDLDPVFRLRGTSQGSPIDAAARSDPFKRSVDRFVAAVRAGDPDMVFCTPGDAARTLAVATAAETALINGQTVPIPDDVREYDPR
jgi:myo-inositol 2-dehydrogenase / D-chiro-inositol 1-dehydrogenase